MKPCYRVDALLSAYLEHETSPAETRFLDSHFETCDRCRRQQHELAALLGKLAGLARVEPSPDFTARVVARTAGLAPAGIDAPEVLVFAPRRPAWALPLAAAAAIALTLVTVTQLARTPVAPVETAQQTSPVAGLPEPGANPAAPSTPAGALPEMVSLGPNQGASPLGMAHDAYVLENYELREPAGGGNPVLTRAASPGDARVVVTF